MIQGKRGVGKHVHEMIGRKEKQKDLPDLIYNMSNARGKIKRMC